MGQRRLTTPWTITLTQYIIDILFEPDEQQLANTLGMQEDICSKSQESNSKMFQKHATIFRGQ